MCDPIDNSVNYYSRKTRNFNICYYDDGRANNIFVLIERYINGGSRLFYFVLIYLKFSHHLIIE